MGDYYCNWDSSAPFSRENYLNLLVVFLNKGLISYYSGFNDVGRNPTQLLVVLKLKRHTKFIVI